MDSIHRDRLEIIEKLGNEKWLARAISGQEGIDELASKKRSLDLHLRNLHALRLGGNAKK